MVEHSTAVREVSGSIRLLPSSLLWVYLLKDFRRSNLRLVLLVHYFDLRRHMNHAFSSCVVVFYDRLSFFFGGGGG